MEILCFKVILKAVALGAIAIGVGSCIATQSEINKFDLPQKNKLNSQTTNFEDRSGYPSNWQISQIQPLNETDFHWNVKTVSSLEGKSIYKLHFFNESIGFAFNKKGVIYKTIDGGTSWEKVSSIGEYTLSDVIFLNPTEGFAIIYFEPSDSQIGEGYVTKIIKTINGGETWKSVYSEKSVSLNKFTHDNNGNWIAVGENYSLKANGIRKLILTSNDNWQNWKEITNKFNESFKSDENQLKSGLLDVEFSPGKGFVLLPNGGKVSVSNNLGQIWTSFDEFITPPCACQLDIDEESTIWISGRYQESDMKRYGIVKVSRNGQKWDTNILPDYFFENVVFISKEIFAIGYNTDNKNINGLVLYSNDYGRNWSIVDKNQSGSRLVSMTKLSEGKFITIDSKGIIREFERAK